MVIFLINSIDDILQLRWYISICLLLTLSVVNWLWWFVGGVLLIECDGIDAPESGAAIFSWVGFGGGAEFGDVFLGCCFF